jgi:hypothetical protein
LLGDAAVINTFTGLGQTIDGNASYTLSGVSGSAPWVTLHASGGNWYVINEFSAGGGGGFTPTFSGFSGSFTGSLLGTDLMLYLLLVLRILKQQTGINQIQIKYSITLQY